MKEMAKNAMDRWLAYEGLEESLRAELSELTDVDEIYDRFYKDLEFGTAGLRGILGAGTNRMNIYTVRRATQGFADYLNRHWGLGGDKFDGQGPSVAIAYDSRINSTLFAENAAAVLAANGIKVWLYPELATTPALSFAVRYYKCSGGIVITASHNPAQYNGYKAYDDQGCQVTEEAAGEILDCINNVDIFTGVKYQEPVYSDLSEADNGQGKIFLIPESTNDAYSDAVFFRRAGIDCSKLKVVDTPLNGTGNKPVRRILDRIGVTNLTVVAEQELPDGNFPTCTYPNPEKKEALERGLALCRELGDADLLIATDPDSDRVGTAVRHEGDYKILTGNEMGVLLLDFLCRAKPLPKRPVAVKTIVSTRLADAIAANYEVELIDVLTGFKYIGEQIKILQDKGEEERFVLGFEESCGYLSGGYVRDKDGVVASMLLCEMAAWYKEKGMTLVDAINALYEKYGYYKNQVVEFTFPGASGMEKMAGILNGLRDNAPAEIAGRRVTAVTDYLRSVRETFPCDGSLPGKSEIFLPKSNVLEYSLDDGCSLIVRPSGTEPKLKIYLSAKGATEADSLKAVDELKAFANSLA